MKRTLMLTLVFAALLPIFARGNADASGNAGQSGSAAANGNAEQTGRLQISFDYSRVNVTASNQVAVWVENESGDVVKTILLTNFVGNRRGYRTRDASLKTWVQAANPEGMSDEEINAISSATPSGGTVTYTWDLRDDDGNPVPAGTYMVYVEGTLFWEDILASASFNTAGPFGPLAVTVSEPQNSEVPNTMLTNVTISYDR